MLFTNTEKFNFAKDPAVVNFKGTYYLYYTIKIREKDDDGWDKIGVGIAVSKDMENWENVSEVSMDMPYEEKGIGAPAAIVLKDKVHLFYQTYGNGKLDAICHAVSDDGINFIKNSDNPVYRPTDDWCCGRAIDADVCEFNGKLFLYIATRDHEMKIQKIGGAWADIDSDFSKKSWTQLTNGSVLAPELKWEGKCIEAAATIVNNGKMFMFYGGSYNCTPQQIGCAVSDDGVFFKRVFSEPFIKCGKAGEWNSSESGHPYAFRDDDGRAYIFYQGSSDMGETWYLSKTEIIFDENNIPHLV
ncbi:MAG: family 43 glycosylhydrolase [Clostridia bacterium]|nr:family 43 glycosylhydrolase [Clostridia bacterium]